MNLFRSSPARYADRGRHIETGWIIMVIPWSLILFGVVAIIGGILVIVILARRD
jgi:hypothetical protein